MVGKIGVVIAEGAMTDVGNDVLVVVGTPVNVFVGVTAEVADGMGVVVGKAMYRNS